MKDYSYYKKIVEENLSLYLPKVSEDADILREAMEYSLNAGGKRLRPVLLLAASDFSNGDINDAIPFSVAIEFIHTYSLIHDDLPAMDDDDLRRGKPTNHIVFGEANAILAGDGLLNSAFQIMAEYIEKSLDDKDVSGMIKAMSIISKASGIQGMVAGQIVDIKSENSAISKETMEYIHLNKTAALIKASVLAGISLGNSNEDLLKSMEKYSENLGLAFQIADDILDIEGNTEMLGKRVGHDIDLNKSTYVSLYGLDQAREILKECTNNAVDSLKEYGESTDFFKKLVIDLSQREK